MTPRLMSTLGAAALWLLLPAVALDAQGKGKGADKANDKGPDKSQAAANKSQGKANDAGARARQAPAQARGNQGNAGNQGRGNDGIARGNADRGRSDDLNRGRVRAAEVRELGGAVAGPSEMARSKRDVKADAKAFRSSMKSGRYFRAYDPNDTPDAWRAVALSPFLSERYVGRVASLALARGVPQDAIMFRNVDDRVLLLNPDGVVLLELDERRVRDMGSWRVVALDDDDEDREGSPAFCRSGAGHPNWGRQWCIDKGFGLGSDRDVRWGRAVSVEDVILRPATTTGDLTRDVLASVLGDVVLNRLAAHAITLGLVDPLVGRWAVEPTGRRVLLVNSGAVPVAEIVDSNRDDRADVLLVALKPW
jgi:hypothetical protein